jgi:carbon monoxide dehydrogenase subunit G
MAFKIEEQFQVRAPVDRVWRYLTDPRQVVHCLPGAELTEEQGERTYLGRVKVKVGPVTAAYSGRAQMTEVNDAERVVRIAAEGKESGGAGSAKMRMASFVTAAPGGAAAAEVRVEAEVDVAGKIVQFGRGMIEAVSKQLFAQFVACVKRQLEGDASVERAAPSVGGTAESAGAPLPATSSAADGAAARPATTPPGVRAQVRPVAVLPLLWRAFREWMRDMLGRTSKV